MVMLTWPHLPGKNTLLFFGDLLFTRLTQLVDGPSGGGNVEVIVSNYPPGAERQLLDFLKRKSKRQWEPLQVG